MKWFSSSMVHTVKKHAQYSTCEDVIVFETYLPSPPGADVFG